MDDSLRAIYLKNPHDWTDDDVRQIRAAPDDDLMRFAGSASYVPIIEATRRLREAIRDEEHAIKWLTAALVALTAALLVLAGFEYWLH